MPAIHSLDRLGWCVRPPGSATQRLKPSEVVFEKGGRSSSSMADALFIRVAAHRPAHSYLTGTGRYTFLERAVERPTHAGAATAGVIDGAEVSIVARRGIVDAH